MFRRAQHDYLRNLGRPSNQSDSHAELAEASLKISVPRSDNIETPQDFVAQQAPGAKTSVTQSDNIETPQDFVAQQARGAKVSVTRSDKKSIS